MDASAQAKTATDDPPGGADQLDPGLLAAWDQTITGIYREQSALELFLGGTKKLATPFFELDPLAGGRERDVLAKWSRTPRSRSTASASRGPGSCATAGWPAASCCTPSRPSTRSCAATGGPSGCR